jgi:hypothetical protein
MPGSLASVAFSFRAALSSARNTAILASNSSFSPLPHRDILRALPRHRAAPGAGGLDPPAQDISTDAQVTSHLGNREARVRVVQGQALTFNLGK